MSLELAGTICAQAMRSAAPASAGAKCRSAHVYHASLAVVAGARVRQILFNLLSTRPNSPPRVT